MLLAMADPKLNAISRVPLFAHLSKREREFIAKEGDEVRVPAGKTLTRQDRAGDTFYVLLDGEAEVKVDGKRRRVLKPGDFFGEISMLDRGLATATVTTLTDARLFVMSHAQFRDAIKGSDQLMLKVLKAMGERLREDLAAKR
ncbi:MAG: cyclic nucleotide-binding domain-containing protein [Chloroflexi bacterium]|nr:MAG: cyclic nucleotide-binding domain-containing protein [Chloroflexota bacterium]TMF12185.1 MAG: cyclic nucleotide-binding domain-containing protein [Chloroflexota bacterium]TMF21547.1 MAG: cyclic nucleotide-binding domain-containing protein [Chloroflexota bacterium]TMF30865.1 MAG: cyclic nucleotide-binding domain-containing protein [Chloroflexota bacterium]TMG27403.1 MAG: cyclic nucleotide-binding domain-containing protein [Chloroflexota bacterium]